MKRTKISNLFEYGTVFLFLLTVGASAVSLLSITAH